MADLTVQEGAVHHSRQLVPLMAQLGYDVTPEEVAHRIARTGETTSDRLFVALVADKVVGCVAVHSFDLFHRVDRLGRITALVVDEGWRGRGVGSALVAAAERFLIHAGCGRIEITSNERRKDAHAFYEARGYAAGSKRFLKSV